MEKCIQKKNKQTTTTIIKTNKKTNHQLYDINALSPRVIALIGNCPLQSKFNNIELLLPISDILRCKCTLFDELTDKCFCIATSYAVTDGNIIASAMKQYCVVIIKNMFTQDDYVSLEKLLSMRALLIKI